MSVENDPEYYETPEHHARELVEEAKEPQVKAIHLDMAKRYARLRAEAARTAPS